MHTQPGRNDPCLCGSGKKYKHCCGSPTAGGGSVVDLQARAPTADDGHEEAVPLAMRWLTERHRKGYQAAFEELMALLWPDDAGHIDLAEGAADMLTINAGEWLLARGEINARGQRRSINAHLLGFDGPGFTEGQRRWIAQLAERPLRLYTVTEVRRDEGLTLVDALDLQAEPLMVRERAGSRSAAPGMLLGARVMRLTHPHPHLQLSGAIYPFAKPWESRALEAVRAALASGLHPENVRDLAELAIARAWLLQWLEPAPLPELRDAYTGEPLLLVTDHYGVDDAAALARSLAAQPDVSGDAQSGWQREIECDDGAVRSLLAVSPGKAAERIEVFYRTQRLADEGRTWFEGVAGTAVRHLTREISDPKGALSKMGVGAAAAPGGGAMRGSGSAADLPPEVMAQAIEQALRRSYANWADEAIPALGHQTPRQAIATTAGLERVKGLLREYEAGEADAAARQERRAISYQFLWDALGIAR